MAHRVHRATPNPGPFARWIAHALRGVRRTRGMTQEQAVRLLAADGVTLHRSTLSRIEAARADLLMSEFFALCTVYRVDPVSVVVTAEMSAKREARPPLRRLPDVDEQLRDRDV